MDSLPPAHSEPAPRRRAPLWAKLLLLLGTLAVLLLPLEFVARARFDQRHERLRVARPAARASSAAPERLSLLDLVQPAPWPDMVYELRPSLEGRFEGASYRSNTLGMRDDEIASPKPPGTFRIALLGDSFSFGWGVEVEQCYANLLETQLSEIGADGAAGRRVDVLNFGVPGYNTAIEAATLEHRALALQPDLVLVQYFYNDVYLPNFVLSEQRRPFSCLLDWVAERLGAQPGGGATLTQPARGAVAPGDAEPEQGLLAAWRRDPGQVPGELAYMVGVPGLERALVRIRDLARTIGAPVALLAMAIPPVRMATDSSVPIESSAQDREVMQLAERLGYTVISTLEPLATLLREQGRSPMEIILSPQDWHPDAEGHEHIARILVDGLTQAGLLAPPR